MSETPDRWFGGDPVKGGWYAPLPGVEPAPQGPYDVKGSVIYFEPEEEETWVLRDATSALRPETLDDLGLHTCERT